MDTRNQVQGDKRPIRVVQISDPHLFSDTSKALLGVNTQESLAAVLRLVKQEQTHIDLVIVTGDISQDATIAAYQRFFDTVQDLDAPVYYLPGNHDLVAPLRKVIPSGHLGPAKVGLGGWGVILLDSSVAGKVHGELAAQQLVFLEQTLGHMSDSHVMVALHHHPMKLGSAWLDGSSLQNPEALWSILKGNSNVRSLVWGHVHQVFDQVRDNIRCFASPSTCIQFKPSTQKFTLDELAPGYRWFDLYEDGRIETHVSRVVDQYFPVDLNGTGY